MSSAVDRLLGLEALGDDVFGATIPARGMPRLFGGQVAAQALLAACRTVEDLRPPHSLHGYFILGGKPGVPLRHEVDRTRDGRSFTTRHVTVRQGEAAIFELLVSFQRPEPGPDWQRISPAVGAIPPPFDGSPHPRLGYLARHFDIRRVDPEPASNWVLHPFWIRTRQAVGDSPALNAAMLTLMSDIALMASARAPGRIEPLASAASLDHAVWFHRPHRVDDWLLYSAEPVANVGARGLVGGSLQTADGALVASVTQEALLRTAGSLHVVRTHDESMRFEDEERRRTRQ
jgi:acyl-CoA thioesterase-2